MIGQCSHDDISCKTQVLKVCCNWSVAKYQSSLLFNSPSQDYTQCDDQTTLSHVTLEFKLSTVNTKVPNL